MIETSSPGTRFVAPVQSKAAMALPGFQQASWLFRTLALAALGLLSFTAATWAQADGVNGTVYALKQYRTTFDCGNGQCCEFSLLIVGGQFTQAGGTPAANIAIWNNGTWQALGTGVDNRVWAIEAVQRFAGDTQPEIYVGGDFGDKGKRIARYSMSAGTWSYLGASAANNGVTATGLPSDYLNNFATVRAIRHINGEIFVGGRFTRVGAASPGGVATLNIARWLPGTSTWQGVGSGMVFCDSSSAAVVGVGSWRTMVTSLFPSSTLLVGVSTNRAAGSPFQPFNFADVEGAYSYNGSTFNALCRAPVVKAIGGDISATVYLGGWPVAASAPWTPAWMVWQAGVGREAGVVERVNNTLQLLGGGGTATPPAGGSPWWPAGSLPSGWKPIGPVNAIIGHAGDHYFGGSFTTLSGAYNGQQIADYGNINNIFKWNGSVWSRVESGASSCFPAGGSGVNGAIHALEADLNACTGAFRGLFAGGAFTQAGGSPASRIARWDGTRWMSLGNQAPNAFVGNVYPGVVHYGANGGTSLSGLIIEGSACDSDGTIVAIEFLVNGAVIGAAEDLNDPWVLWQPPTAGTYNLQVRATDNGGATGTSAILPYTVSAGDVPPAPAAPSGLAATTVSSSQINLSWIDNSGNEAGFRVERSPNGSSGWVQIAELTWNTTQYPDSGLAANTTYYYRVRAFHYGQNSAYSPTASGLTAPLAPTGVAANPGVAQVTVSWNPSVGATSYRVKRSTSPGGAQTIFTAAASPYVDGAVTGGTLYYYVVSAVNAGGESANSSQVSATPSKPVITVQTTDGTASECSSDTGVLTISRTGNTSQQLTVFYSVTGTATAGSDYANNLGVSVNIPVGAGSVDRVISPLEDTTAEPNETIILTVSANANYIVGIPGNGTVTMIDNDLYWQGLASGLGGRVGHTTVFTGTEVIVWGGGAGGVFFNTGARYNIAANSWSATTTVNAPTARWFHTAVWTGSEMIVWGGRASFYSAAHLNDGKIYNPTTDTWRPMNANGPSARSQMAAVWTGAQMLIWGGGGDNFDAKADGYLYAYAPDIWEPLPATTLEGRLEPSAVWTQNEMIVFGGFKIDDYQGPTETWRSLATGARYHYNNETWTTLPTGGAAPSSRTAHTAVWSGNEMLIWGGRYLPDNSFLNTGARYNPALNSWTAMTTANAPQARLDHAAVWTGAEMIVWGGYVNPTPLEVNTGGHYNPVCNIWTASSTVSAPAARFFGRSDGAVWTGNGMFIFGGWDYPNELNSTGLYRRAP